MPRDVAYLMHSPSDMPHVTPKFMIFSLAVASLTAGSTARGAEREDGPRHGRESVEVELATHFGQGLGMLRTTDDDQVHTTGPGLGLGLMVGARRSPHAFIGVSALYEMFSRAERWYPGDDGDRWARSLRLGLEVVFHPSPFGTTSPYLTAGVGYRVMWVPADEKSVATQHGPQLLKLGGGFDIFATDGFAIGPWASADLGITTWDNGGAVESGVAVFVQSGLHFVFNVGSMKKARSRDTGRR